MEKAGVALYHRVLRRENFEKAAKDLVSLVYAAEKKEPGKPRTLYLDIDGHRNAQGEFDADMLELQEEFGLRFLLPFLTEVHFPLISTRNKNPQRNDVPDRLGFSMPEMRRTTAWTTCMWRISATLNISPRRPYTPISNRSRIF